MVYLFTFSTPASTYIYAWGNFCSSCLLYQVVPCSVSLRDCIINIVPSHTQQYIFITHEPGSEPECMRFCQQVPCDVYQYGQNAFVTPGPHGAMLADAPSGFKVKGNA